MKALAAEIEANFTTFCKSCAKGLRSTSEALAGHKDSFLDSYRRLVSLNAWRTELLGKAISPDSLGFFLEAQNDALTSHVLAASGSWRSALQALRSCVENTLYAMYYKDHPVELQLWQRGGHRLNFRELMPYFSTHLGVADVPPAESGLDFIAEQYRTLSQAVHASAQKFRMSAAGVGIQLWTSDPAQLGKWGTNEKCVVVGLNRLLMTLFRAELQQNRLPNLRRALSLVIPERYHASIKTSLGVTLFT